MTWKWICVCGVLCSCLVSGCGGDLSEQWQRVPDPLFDASVRSSEDPLTIDSATGIPYALIFQFPVQGFDTADFGFGFGSVNSNFCLVSDSTGCKEYGAHTGRDTIVGRTPVGTTVLAPADGIVRVTTDRRFRAFGSDSAANASYSGCLVVLEHELANSRRVTTLLGHLACGSGPSVGTIVQRGQAIARVAHYWHGSGMATDWHHLHWGMRRGAYSEARLNDIVRGYASPSAFTRDAATNAVRHSSYLDPFVLVVANGDLAAVADAETLHHPPGTLLQDEKDQYWLVGSLDMVRLVSSEIVRGDRYDVSKAVRVTSREMGCYTIGEPMGSLGRVTLYQRPGSSTVVMAYDDARTRYDVIRWEALLSWGFSSKDLTMDSATIARIEDVYIPNGMRLLRPGTLVKAEESSEVSIVTPQYTRIPIVSEVVFEQLGFRWEHIVSIPQSVIERVAGSRESFVIDGAYLHAACGGGGLGEVDDDARIHLSYAGSPVSGPIGLSAWWQPPQMTTRGWDIVRECIDDNVSDRALDCAFVLPHHTTSFEFQITLPNGSFWGDASCTSTGGCDHTVGDVTLTSDGSLLRYALRPNNTSGQPYFNGFVEIIP